MSFTLPALIGSGNRNGTLYSYACSLQARGRSDAEVAAMVADANRTRCVPPLGDHEVETIVRQALSYDKGTPREDAATSRQAEDGITPATACADLPVDPAGQIAALFRALYGADDHISYTVDAYPDDISGKWHPGRGVNGRTVGEIVEMLDRTHDVENSLGSWEPEAGAWFTINPTDGQGKGKRNITRYKYCLIESDELPLDEQITALINDPCVVSVVLSGGRSAHGIRCLDASNLDEWERRRDETWAWYKAQGFAVDENCKDPSRLTRLPGVTRGDQLQELVYLNPDAMSYGEWASSLVDDRLPEWKTYDALAADPTLHVSEELIADTLRKGHLMLFASGAKCGKTWLSVRLAVAVAEGATWLGHKCRQGRVLLVNPEVDMPSYIDRINITYENMHLTPTPGQIIPWTIRGIITSLQELTPVIIRRAQELGPLDLIVIDPVYTLMFDEPGDSENDTRTVLKAMANCNHIAAETGASVVMTHHFNKASGGQSGTDRIAGSSTWKRYPDAVMILEQLDADPAQLRSVCDNFASAKVREALGARGIPCPEGMSADHLAAYAYEHLPAPDQKRLNGELEALVKHTSATAYRASWTLREFPDCPPTDLWYVGTYHIVDKRGILAGCDIARGARANDGSGRTRSQKANDDAERLRQAFLALDKGTGEVRTKTMAEYLGVDVKTVKTVVQKCSGFELAYGVIKRSQDPEAA